MKEEVGDFSEEDRVLRCSLKSKLDLIWGREEICWRQKFKDLWLKAGDRNTSFFHRSANERGRKNWVDRISVGGQIFIGHSEVAAAIANYFKSFYDHTGVLVNIFPAGLSFGQINMEKVDTLTAEFSMEEVLQVIKNTEGDKAPGPNGFNLTFYKACWPIIGNDVVEALRHFQVSSFIPITVNSTFICLIPKKEAIGDIKDLRPISLVGSSYKILSKCLMRRFREVLKDVISPYQSAFLDGRQITEASLVANEVIDARRAAGKNGLVFKLDLKKAFDSVRWQCIIDTLSSFGFPQKWIDWVRTCISTVHFSVLVNGEPIDFFRNRRGPGAWLDYRFSYE
ncbi:Transposon TX1 uncharacterized 149 kDa protein [Linum grandiflorum]